MWDVDKGGELVAVLSRGHKQIVTHCAWASTGTVFATGSRDGTVIIWDGTDLRSRAAPLHRYRYTDFDSCAKRYREVDVLLISPDSSWLLIAHRVAHCSHSHLRLLDITAPDSSDPCHKTIHVHHEGPICAAAFDPVSRRIATALLDGSIAIWDIQTGAELATMRYEQFRWMKPLPFSPDGTSLLCYRRGGPGSRIVEWALEGSITQLESRGDQEFAKYQSATYSPDGRFIAAIFDHPEGVQLWRASDGSYAGMLKRERKFGHPYHFNAYYLAFTPDGRWLASGDVFGGVEIHGLDSILDG